MTLSEHDLNQLTDTLDIYSDCWSCGAVINDPNLLKPDPLNPGRFRALCPSCKEETTRFEFPPTKLRPLFEMIVECAKLSRPILTLTLACTAYEAMMDGFVYRLLERRNCDEDVCLAFLDLTEHRTKANMIEYLTGRKIEKLAKGMGFRTFFHTLETIRARRNNFIHTGNVHKPVKNNIGAVSIFKEVQLNESDTKRALLFTEKTIHFLAALYTAYGKWHPLYEEDY